jgi:hypothetical protein
MEQDSATPDVRGPEEGVLYVSMGILRCSSYTLIFPDLSLEFLMGRALDNAMLNVGLKDAARGRQSVFSYL